MGVVAWYKLAEVCYETLKRGSAVLIDGELQSRPWRNEDGSSRNVIEVRARRIQFLDRKVEINAEELSSSKMSVTSPSAQSSTGEEEPSTTSKEHEDEIIAPTDFDFGYQDLKL